MKKSTIFSILAILIFIAICSFGDRFTGFEFYMINAISIIGIIGSVLISIYYSDKELAAKERDKNLKNK